MGDAGNATSQPQRAGYFQQYLARMAPTPLPPPPMPFPASSTKPSVLSRGLSDRRSGSKDAGNKGKPKAALPRKTLVDAFKQHGMKLCDGSKLNAVGKGVTHLGVIPPTLGVHITALYLSQNDLRGLDGVDQFQNVRLLSVAANLLTRFADVERLGGLPQLRHVNLLGNPVCDQPNYRFRAVDALAHVQVLDTVEISKQEREFAPFVASQDRALREMVMRNHVEIQKLQRLAVWVGVLGELQCGVLRDAVTGRFDQLPSTQGDGILYVERFLRVWKYEDALSARERDTLETQMLAIITRTRAKMVEETPQRKAKEMLFKLANAPLPARRGKAAMTGLSVEMRREHAAWEDAYAHVMQLQQQTIANLCGECDRNRREVVQSLRQLVVVNPFQRRGPTPRTQQSRVVDAPARRVLLPPSKGDEREPDEDERQQHCVDTPTRDETREDVVTSKERLLVAMTNSADRKCRQTNGDAQAAATRRNPVSLRRVLRSGEFGNKTLHEAIQSFALRQPDQPRQAPTRPPFRLTSTAVQAHAAGVSIGAATRVEEHHVAQFRSQPAVPPPRFGAKRCQHTGSVDDLESCGVVGSETVDSGDTTYAPSVGGFSVDSRSDLGSCVFGTSQAQYTRQRDDTVEGRGMRSHELHTVEEEHGYVGNVSLQDEDGDDGMPQRREEFEYVSPPSARKGDAAIQPRYLSERQHELETREEKYIAALMDSEQRELDLRHQITLMQKQLEKVHQLVSENDAERQQIKSEIAQRACAVARPTLLRRFFSKWIQFHHWSLQLEQVRRRRRFVIQHDAFWGWRRQVWARHEFQRIQRRHQARLLRCHVVEWANFTRISVISVHTQALRQSQLLKRVLAAWRQEAHVKRLTSHMRASKESDTLLHVVASIFGEWKRLTRRSQRIQRLHEFYTREADTSLMKVAMINWKMFVLSVARPRRARVEALAAQQRVAAKSRHFLAWKRAMKCGRLHRLLLVRRTWQAWRTCLHHSRTQRERTLSSRRNTLQAHLCAWHGVASDRAGTRRSLNLATRHVNHRKLRKLWMHWKIYSISRKRYMQGASKALKHYFIKLLRRSWARWKAETRENLQSMKQRKRCELRYHFNALRDGVRRVLHEKKRQVIVVHAARRRQLVLVRNSFTQWAARAKRHARCQILHRILSGQRSRALVGFVWSRWKHRRMVKVEQRLLQASRRVQSVAHEKKDVEEEMLELNDRSISLCEQVRALTLQVDAQAADIKSYQDALLHRERVMVALEKDVAELRTQLKQCEQDREDARRHQEMERQTREARVAELEREQTVLTEGLRELESTSTTAHEQVAMVQNEKMVLETRLVDLRAQHDQLRSSFEQREDSLRSTISELDKRLLDEQREREDTVRKLQEYESRIASTCAEIEDHEVAHERECIQLRTENSRIEILWKEEAVRNAELQRLLSEKNDQIIALSSRLKNAQLHDEDGRRTRLAAQGSHTKQPVDALNDTVDECDGPLSAADCVGQPASPRQVNTLVFCVADERTVDRVVSASERRHVAKARTESQPAEDTEDAPVAVRSNPVSCPAASIAAEPSEEEQQIDARTSRIHADIQLLQERITKRLQQIPCVLPVEQLAGRKEPRDAFLVESDGGSVSTLSESEHERERERKALRRPPASSSIKSRQSQARSSLRLSQGRTAGALVDRENNSLVANGPTSIARRHAQPHRPRVDPCPPQRASATSAEPTKPKKRVSVRSTSKGAV